MRHENKFVQNVVLSRMFPIQPISGNEARFANLGKITPSFDPQHVIAQIPLMLEGGVHDGCF